MLSTQVCSAKSFGIQQAAFVQQSKRFPGTQKAVGVTTKTIPSNYSGTVKMNSMKPSGSSRITIVPASQKSHHIGQTQSGFFSGSQPLIPVGASTQRTNTSNGYMKVINMMLPSQPPKMAFTPAPRMNLGPSSVVQRNFPIMQNRRTTAMTMKASADEEFKTQERGRTNIDYSIKFGGSSVANADRMLEVFKLVKEQYVDKGDTPAVILSAMGKTTNNLLASGQKALQEGVVDVSYVQKLTTETIKQLDIPEIQDEIDLLLQELESLLTGVTMLKELSPRSNDYLVSFGERISTRIFAAYCNKMGMKAVQFDAFEMGFITNDAFMNADIQPETYKLVKSSLSAVPKGTVPIITGFLGKAKDSGAITTLGRGGSDLSASIIGASMNTQEIHVWKDVDGVLTADPREVPNAKPVPVVTFREASELAFFGAQVLHPLSMRPAWEYNIPVRVRNSYNPAATGTVITSERKNNLPVTSLVEKKNVILLDIVSTRMLNVHGFMAKVFQVFQEEEISVDVVATSEVSISLTLDPSQCTKDAQLARAVDRLSEFSDVTTRKDMSIVSIIGNTQHSAEIIGRAGLKLSQGGIQIEMASIGASKVNLSLVIQEEDAKLAIKLLHDEFYPCKAEAVKV